jgi:hypothetical protein
VTFVSSNDGDAEDSDSATDIEEIQIRQKKKSKDANKKDKSNKSGSKKKKSKDSETDEANSSGPESDGHRGGPENGFQGQLNRGILKKGAYPEGVPYPSQRTPNYIEPVRAEVVLTERVVESPNDPPPNAYYDAEHNVMRVYHGPVWGTTSNQGLYPRKGSSRPLPVGMPHPSQNPYLAGFAQDHGQGQRGQGKNPDEENNNIMPVTQGMPVNTWPAMYPPPGFPSYDAAHFGGHPYWQQPPMPPPFASGAAGDGPPRAPSSQDKDKAGASNVMPPGIAADKVCYSDEPYEWKPRMFTDFALQPATEDRPASNAGSQTNHWGTGSNGNGKGSSAKGGNDNWAGFGDDSNNNNQDNAWGSNNNCNNSWNGGGSNHNNNNTGWGSQQNNSQNGGNGSTKGDNTWGESNTNNNNNNNNNTTGWGSSSWGNGADNNITGWGNTSTSNDNNNGWGNGTGSTNNNNDWGTSGNNGSNSGNANATSAWDTGNNEQASSSSPVLGGFDLFNEPDDQKVQNWDDNGKKNNRNNKQRGRSGKHDAPNSNAGSTNDNQGGAFAVFSRKDDSVGGAGDNNIMPTVNMPGAYSWGDPSAAASTGGKADKW